MEEQDQILIEAYTNGTLSGEQEKAVADRIVNDAAFAQALKEHQDLLEVLNTTVEKDLKNLLQREEKSLQKRINSPILHSKKVKTISIAWLSVAAAIALAIVAGGLWFNRDTQLDQNDLYTTYFVPYTNIVAPNKRGQSNLNPLNRAFELYDKGAYQKAISSFTEIRQDTLYNTLTFYLGVSHLANDNPQQAINTLSEIKDSETNLLMERYWYSALSYLALDDTNNSIRFLEKAISVGSDPILKKKAVELITRLQP